MLMEVNVENRLKGVLEEFIEDWGVDEPIRRETTLVEDLGFDSIDVIQFIVAVETAFGQRNLGFQGLIMKDGRYVDDLAVGEMVDFLEERLRA